MTSDRYALLDAAYVLGALDADERAAFEQHLVGCADCRAAVDHARATLALLDDARAAGALTPDPTDVTDPGPVPDTLLPGLLQRARREQRRRRSVGSALALVAVAAVAALVVVLWPSSGSAPARAQALTPVRPTPVSATAVLTAKPWGTEIDLHCRYASALAGKGYTYGLRVIDTSRTSHDAGSWALGSGGETDFTGGTSVPRDRIRSVQVTLPDGTPILQLTQ